MSEEVRKRKSEPDAEDSESVGIATINGADLYYEVRGTGPTLLFIMGATGDGGHFDEVADHLTDEFTSFHRHALDRRLAVFADK
jgi:pimeloyl-ACP methyl ester carboxylesterase